MRNSPAEAEDFHQQLYLGDAKVTLSQCTPKDRKRKGTYSSTLNFGSRCRWCVIPHGPFTLGKDPRHLLNRGLGAPVYCLDVSTQSAIEPRFLDSDYAPTGSGIFRCLQANHWHDFWSFTDVVELSVVCASC